MKHVEELCEDSCTGTGAELVRSTKKQMIPQEKAAEFADIFKALGDPTRVKIIYALLQNGELCVHDLCVVLDMTQSAVSHQLRYLRNMHIVKRRKLGKTVYYSLDDHHIEQIFMLTLEHLTHV